MQLLNPITLFCALVLSGTLVAGTDNETSGQPAKKGLMRWLSFGGGSSKSEEHPAISPQDDTYVNNSELGEGHNNKVSELLHFIHRKSSNSVYKKPAGDETGSDSDEEDSAEEKEPDYRSMSDQELLESFCNGRTLINLCKKAVNAALRKNPEDVARIAQSIRNKPAHVDARKLLAHKLFETGVVKMESKGYDKALDKAITVVATRNPYMYGAVKAIDLTRKLT